MARLTPVPASVLRRVFELAGLTCSRIEGDHFVFTKPRIVRPVVIPNWNPVPVFIIRNNLRTAGISRSDHFRGERRLRLLWPLKKGLTPAPSPT